MEAEKESDRGRGVGKRERLGRERGREMKWCRNMQRTLAPWLYDHNYMICTTSTEHICMDRDTIACVSHWDEITSSMYRLAEGNMCT